MAEPIGKLLKDLRRQQNLTGVILGEKVGLSQSKISKIETGAYQPTIEEIEKLLNILKPSEIIRQQIHNTYNAQKSLHEGKTYTMNFRYDAHAFDVEQKAKEVRVFCMTQTPALLQTASYREGLLRHFDLSEEEIKDNLRTTLGRQDRLWAKGRSWHFLILETGLYTAAAGALAQREQLDRLERLISTSQVTLGIIPYNVGFAVVDVSTFVLYDTHHVSMCVAGVDIMSTDSGDVRRHQKLFDELHRKAVYGQEAISLVRAAYDHFN